MIILNLIIFLDYFIISLVNEMSNYLVKMLIIIIS